MNGLIMRLLQAWGSGGDHYNQPYLIQLAQCYHLFPTLSDQPCRLNFSCPNHVYFCIQLNIHQIIRPGNAV